jgi:hypothetical protein
MSTGAEFKKHIAKPFGNEMRLHGFKGTGLEYRKETSDYLFAVWIELGRWGGSCSAGFAVHPKVISENSKGVIDFTKLKIYEYEWKMGLTKVPRGEKWPYASNEAANLAILAEITGKIKQIAFPVIEQFTSKPSIIDLLQVTEMDDFHKNWTSRTGVSIATTDLRFAWAMTVVLEKTNPIQAVQFAKWAYSQLGESDKNWFGVKDLERVVKLNNGG